MKHDQRKPRNIFPRENSHPYGRNALIHVANNLRRNTNTHVIVQLFPITCYAFLKQDVICEWTLDFNMQANVLYNAEVRDNRICCCDTETCYARRNNTHLCSLEVSDYQCDVRVLIILSPCITCPSDCCLMYDVGNDDTIEITNASFQIGGKPTSKVSEAPSLSPSFPLKYILLVHISFQF